MKHRIAAAVLAFAAVQAWAQDIEVSEAWARASVPGQKATGAFMKLSSKAGARLVGVVTPAAGVAEVHEMKMDGNVMRMRAIAALDLPAGKTVELKPGGFHLMLMDLKAPLAKDSTLELTLLLQDAKGVETRQNLRLPVKAMAPAGHNHAH